MVRVTSLMVRGTESANVPAIARAVNGGGAGGAAGGGVAAVPSVTASAVRQNITVNSLSHLRLFNSLSLLSKWHPSQPIKGQSMH